MHARLHHIVLAIGIYAMLVLGSLALALLGPLPPGRSVWLELGLALGFIGLAMMGLQFVLTARFQRIAAPFGQDVLLRFHREAGLLAAALVVAHPVILLVARPQLVSFLDPRVNLPRAVSLTVAMVALALVVVLPLVRRRIGFPYEWWRLTHGALALCVIGIGLAHTLMVGHYVSTWWKQGAWIVMTLAAMGLLAHVRIVRPLALRRRPWRVAEVRREIPRVWTIALEPDGHEGLRFEAGQFVGLTLGRSPLAVQQHPFTIASSAAAPGRIELTIKQLGDFTGKVGETKVGDRAFLEGPYGSFTVKPALGEGRGPDDVAGEGAGEGAPPVAMMVGGIGVTPAMSILRTMRDAGDRRRITLFYATNSLETAPFCGELQELARVLNLNLVHVLESPPEGWTGEEGYMTRDLLARHLGDDAPGMQHMICGPVPMMDAVERALLELGAPLLNIHSERFDIA